MNRRRCDRSHPERKPHRRARIIWRTQGAMRTRTGIGARRSASPHRTARPRRRTVRCDGSLHVLGRACRARRRDPRVARAVTAGANHRRARSRCLARRRHRSRTQRYVHADRRPAHARHRRRSGDGAGSRRRRCALHVRLGRVSRSARRPAVGRSAALAARITGATRAARRQQHEGARHGPHVASARANDCRYARRINERPASRTLRAGLTPERERTLLQAWVERAPSSLIRERREPA